jgi:GPN-loop GTPase
MLSDLLMDDAEIRTGTKSYRSPPAIRQTVTYFVQLVIGPPGAGKTTFCNGMHQFLGALGRKSSVVNLDAANDGLSYPCALDISSLITLEDIMEHEGLGPNGGIMYALETLEENFDWLQDGLRDLGGIISVRL